MIRLFNTLSGQIEALTPADGQTFRMYACGPTVYDYGHIGNFRTFCHVDVLRRALQLEGITVRHVMNVTDVDDKIIRNATRAGVPIAEYTKKYEQAFFEDLHALGVAEPEVIARATEHIPAMVKLIEQLAAQDIAYKTEDGSWYFRIARFKDYGKLSKKDLTGISDGARVDVDEYEKDSARDFALWKSPKPGEHFWETPLGAGRPGWHIECSAMAMEYLGESIDLHGGGEDLMFPHHENEIAQSECASHKTFARHWFHVRFLLVEGRKMSKSEGNFYTLRDLLLKGYKASAIRMLLISVPYRQQLNFTFEGLAAETTAVERLRTFYQRMLTVTPATEKNAALSTETEKARKEFRAGLENDLNTAEARAAIFDLVRAGNAAADAGTLSTENVAEILAVLREFDSVFNVLEDRDAAITKFALEWAEQEGRLNEAAHEVLAQRGLSDEQIQALVDERTKAKRARNFARADQIRNELAEKGIVIEDSKEGVRWKRK
ncbi:MULTISPECIES: cysteine--tRNA ligase [Acidobacterium]|uniref:Cysteine--tRNA ligase n=1 Tax=Acidobacterium capsulatum (strain ATCC 51196 / DSM 11244 / BCRC 80197 / JCM 7670 / NBRC 15755 / NCIMB 13165 / 161) TaxID=240015 RepID=C1F9R1_ACIC5|nr:MULTISPECIES: cysteine--tRNA ligase [Acidobacterium]ACO31330.1 cysteine--tRNA ligase [Acidobacterium capsulatum ATCC 51196]HCT62264.1 cysteine--tRNA ligase [Acidobacterium sp.]